MRRSLGNLALACAVLGGALALGAGGTVAATSSDGNDVEGPLDLADAAIEQKGTKLIFTVRNRGPLPDLRELTRFPSRLESEDQRYLCLQLLGPKVGHNLFCPGGRSDGKRVKLGHSTYGKDGAASKSGAVAAKVLAGNDDTLSVRFSLKDADLAAGKVRWRVISGWTGEECTAAGGTGNACLDRTPDGGYVQDRIFKLQLAGCKSPGGQFRSAPRAGKQVALTFDDGPSGYTAEVVSILNRFDAKGTFFVIGSQVSGGADILRKALKHGHELANHSYNHESLPGSSSMQATNKAIERATGFKPCEFRPPYGAVNSSVVSAANSLGMSTVLWDIDTNDWQTPGSGAIYNSATNAGPGSIVLMHDGGGDRSGTVAALPGIIENLQDRGFKLVTVTEILGGKFKLEEKR
jgi:peptidoglycan/xylan/chitin deacetylase (PgdA/CDA1 family)